MLWLQQFFSDPVGMAVQAVLVVVFVDFMLSVAAAYRDKTFTWSVVDAFLRSQVMGRVVPITLMLLAGYFGNQPLITALGIAGAAAYVTATVASFAAKWGTNRVVQPVPTA